MTPLGGPMRIFRLAVGVSGDFMRTDPMMAEALAREILQDQARNLRGPRGGRYAAVGAMFGVEVGELVDDWITANRTVQASIAGRYVRPTRATP